MTNSNQDKKFNYLALFFPAAYYAGKGSVKKGFIYAVVCSLPFLCAIGPFVAAFKAKELKFNGFDWKKAISVGAIHLIFAIISFNIFTSVKESLDTKNEALEITLVKNGSFPFCPNKTVGEMAAGFFGSPKWSSVESNGIKYVNVEGKMRFLNKNVKGELQFAIEPNNEEFSYNAFEINGKAQGKLIVNGLFKKMCE